jgi:DNA-binding GntR family transcriptional regulator
VACPSPEEARDIFQARRTVEPTVVENAVQRITDAQLAILDHDAGREIAASEAGKRHEAIRLSGQFHVRLAEFAGNQVLARIVEGLVARTSLIIGLFGSSRISSCAREDHGALIRTIAARDAALATKLMVDHLNHIESELELRKTNEKPVDVREVLMS